VADRLEDSRGLRDLACALAAFARAETENKAAVKVGRNEPWSTTGKQEIAAAAALYSMETIEI
jgi:hypothetical protein